MVAIRYTLADGEQVETGGLGFQNYTGRWSEPLRALSTWRDI